MEYRTVKLNDFELEIEVGVVPANSTSDFLSNLTVISNTLAKNDYEEFLLASLTKNFNGLIQELSTMENEQDRRLIRFSLLEYIYQLNPRLKPDRVVIHKNKLLHLMDSLKSGGPSEPTLTMNPGWLESVDSVEVDTASLKKLVEKIWEEVKTDSARSYVLKPVALLGTELPILKLSSVPFDFNDFVMEYLYKKCDGNLFLARSDKRLWIGYVIAFTIPGIAPLVDVFKKGGFVNKFSEHVLYGHIYSAVVQVNPDLNYDNVDWDSFSSVADPQGDAENARRVGVSSRTPLTRGNQQLRESREEAEAEKPKFKDVPYEKVIGLSEEVKTRIIGQDDAVDSICESIAVARVGLRGDKKPIGTFLFAGKTGVGKTELAKVLAEALTNNEPIRIDCSEYQQAHEIAKIFGAPPGYIGFEDEDKNPHKGPPPTTVASKLKERPFSVVLFDEIEKADPAINNVLLQIMDEGHVTSGRGDTISFNNALVILTSNVGTAEAEEACAANRLGFGEDDRDLCSLSEETINDAIKERFKPEFRNRLSDTIIFNSLSRDVCRGIADVLLGKTRENLEKAQHVTMAWDDSVREHILDEGYSEEFGAREMERVIRKSVELPLAKHILDSVYKDKGKRFEQGAVLQLSMKDGELDFKIEDGRNEKANTKRRRVSRSRTANRRPARKNSDKT